MTSKCVSNATSGKLGGMSIEALDISDRMKNLLINSGIMRIDQLVAFDADALSCHRWFHSKVRRSEFEDAVLKARALLSGQKTTNFSTE